MSSVTLWKPEWCGTGNLVVGAKRYWSDWLKTDQVLKKRDQGVMLLQVLGSNDVNNSRVNPHNCFIFIRLAEATCKNPLIRDLYHILITGP